MIANLSLEEWIELMDISQFDTASDDATGQNFFGSDIPEAKVRYPWALIVSNTVAGTNTFDLSKIEEDDTETLILNDVNLAQDETLILGLPDIGPVIPRLEGGTNLEIQAASDGVEATVFYFDGPEV